MTVKNLRRRGFSLVEVLFGVFLTGLCAMVLAATMPIANVSREKANNLNVALSLAQKQAESLRSLGYANLTADRLLVNGRIDSTVPVSSSTWSFTNVEGAVADSPAQVLPNGQGLITIQQAGIDLRSVTIEVRWTESGRQRSIAVGTMVANL